MDKKMYTLSRPQKTIWYMEKLYKDSGMTNICGTVRFKIGVDFELLRKAINIFVSANDAMRVKVLEDNGTPYQYIKDYKEFEVKFVDFSDKTKEEFYRWEEIESKKPIDTSSSELFEFIMIKFSDLEGGYLIKVNHIISDAWSIMLLVSDIKDIYSELVYGNFEKYEKPSYLDYIDSEEEYFNSKRYISDKEYWEEKLKDFEEVTTLKDNVGDKSFTNATRKTFLVPEKLNRKMKSFCEENKVSEYALFIGALAMYINRVKNKENILFGTSLLNRTGIKEKETIGMFASTAVPLKVDIKDDTNFSMFIKEISKEILSVLRHQKYPYEDMLKIAQNANKSTDKIFDIVLNYQNAKGTKGVLEHEVPYSTRWNFNGEQIESLIVNVNDRDNEGKLIIDYDFLNHMFCIKEIEFLHQHIINILWHALDNPEKVISKLEMLSEDEKRQILFDFNDTEATYNKNITIHELFEEIVKKYPNNIAVKFENETITYRELNEKANSLARTLRKLGVRRQDIIAVIMYKSINTIIATLGILKAGAAYLPIDPDFPSDRKNFMITDCNSRVLITEQKLKNENPFDGTVICLDEEGVFCEDITNLENINESGDLIYIIYTSGSTGNPKGVMLEHRNVVRLLFNSKFQYDFNENDVWTMFHSYCFDFSVWEMYGALLYGGKLIIISKETSKDLNKFVKLLREENVSVLNQTPAMFYNVINEEMLYNDADLNIRYVIFGGEALNPSKLKPFREKYQKCKLINMYGITETTVHVTFKELSDDDIENGKSNIGKPIPTLKTYIMDKNLNLLPIGIPGEICVSGDGVARGYLNQKELTNKKFVVNPYSPNERLYRSGDLGRFFARGDMEYLGRIDSQVKVRGFRVEIGEIERNISSFPKVKDVVVIPKKDENEKSYLVAYLVCTQVIDIQELKKHLGKFMPTYMIPSYFVFMEKLPINANGKINRKELPEPLREIKEDVPYVEPRDKTDKVLQTVFSEVLKLENIGIDNDFFAMGGDSLTVIQALTKLYKYDLGISATEFYKYPTIRLLSNKVKNNIQLEDDMQRETFAVVPDFKLSEKLTNREMKNVLVTGATGFLGSHIVKNLLDNTEAKVYCLVRGSSQAEARERFYKVFKFYFNTQYCEDRIEIINGDITMEDLGVGSEMSYKLGRTIDNIIHTAALVKYYGDYKEFETINIAGVRNVMIFAKKYDIKLNHISTIGISGSYLVRNNINSKELTEKDLYVGQNYTENAYVKTKFLAENMLLNEISNGLKLTIFRMGNLTGRYSDGYFQKNAKDNAFYNILKSIIELKKVSSDMDDVDVELTPVDMAANCVVSIAKTNECDSRIFHITNYKEPHFEKIRHMLVRLGFDIQVISNDEFNRYIKEVSGKDEESEILRGIITDVGTDGRLNYNIPVKATANITAKYLKMLGFEWPDIEIEYVKKIVNYLNSINYFETK